MQKALRDLIVSRWLIGFALIMTLVCLRESISEQRGVVLIKDAAGQEVGLYRESYALLVGMSDYTGGWPDL